jgi:hypothetical protein
MGNISLVFKNSSYQPTPPINPPDSTWTPLGDTPGYTGDGIVDDIVYAVNIGPSDGYVWAGSKISNNMWIYSNLFGDNWTWEVYPSFQFPYSSPNFLEVAGLLYTGFDSYGIYKNIGSWTPEYNPSGDPNDAKYFNGKFYVCSGYYVYVYDGSWSQDLYAGNGVLTNGFEIHNGELWCAVDNGTWRLDNGTLWTYEGSFGNKVTALHSATNGKLYGMSKKNTPISAVIYQWRGEGLGWDLVGSHIFYKIAESRNPQTMMSYGNYLYYGGSEFDSPDWVTRDLRRIDLTNITLGTDNSVSAPGIGTATIPIVFDGVLYAFEYINSGTQTKIWVYRE